jgi:exo-beta-1,3-glucanase (GH17 family)
MSSLSWIRRQHGWAWLIVLALALFGAWGWWSLGRPVALPDAPSGRIACVSYAPFRLPGETPLDAHAFISPQRIDEDLRALSQRFDCVRTYSQGQGLSAVPEIAQRHGMQVLLGIWLGRDRQSNAEQIRVGIATARKYPHVLRGVVVGNEVLLRGELSPQALAGYLREVRDAVDVPVTYADVWEFWLRHPQLADSVDYVTIHILPYWEDHPVAPEHALQHVADVYARVRAAFPGREVMIGETGWPSAGRPRQAAVASLVNEARYLRGFLDYAAQVQLSYNVIEAFDQPWKRAQEGTVGGYWGIFDAQMRPKFALSGPVVEDPHWWRGWLAGLAGAAVFMLFGARARRWRGRRGWVSLGLMGFASGAALAWQGRQLAFAARDGWEWTIALAACAAALVTALLLARCIAARLAAAAESCREFSSWPLLAAQRGDPEVADGTVAAEALASNSMQAVVDTPVVTSWLRLGWLFAMAFYGLLLVFDGRYRDFPLGLFALPGVGYALLGGLSARGLPWLEERFLAAWLPVLAAVVVVHEAGVTTAAWLWLALNIALAWPVLQAWWCARRRLRPQQA